MENSRWCCWYTVAETAVPPVVQVDRSSQCYAGELFVVRCADIAVDDGSWMEEREHKIEQLLRSRKKFVPKKGQQIKIIGFIICAKRLDFAG